MIDQCMKRGEFFFAELIRGLISVLSSMKGINFSIHKIICLILLLMSGSLSQAQDYQWTTDADAIYRDGQEFFLRGQSWAKKTPFLNARGEEAETDVKRVFTELNSIGVNTLRIYGSPNDSDWDGSPNFDLLIKWIEEWNVDNPDGGDPNNAMYYMVQMSPGDAQSSINSNLPENSSESFDRSINDLTNPESVASLVKKVDDITGGSQYLLGYLIYHEFNVSSKYSDWEDAIGLQGIEDFMNTVADSLHNRYAPGKLVSHTGDAKDDNDDIYEGIEALDDIQGNVFQEFDLIGFNLYISSHALISENNFYDRIVNRRALSINDNRGWFIGETGPSFDKLANSSSVAAANYTNPEGGANLQLMYTKSMDLGNMIGFMLFTVQDNDLGTPVGDDIKQRGYYDVYGEKKFLYYVYPDILNKISSNHRKRLTENYLMELSIEENASDYKVSFRLENYTDQRANTYRYSIYSDNGSGGNQRFGQTISDEYVTLGPCESIDIAQTVAMPTSKLVVASASLIREFNPENAYLWGREHILEDALCTVAGLNQFLDNPQEVEEITTEECQALPADLTVQWSNPTPEVFFGDTLTLSLEVSNAGPSDATGLEVDVTIGEGFSILETIYDEGILSSDFSSWTIDALGEKDSAEMHFRVKVLEKEGHTITASVEGVQDDPSVSDNEFTIKIQPQEVLNNNVAKTQVRVLTGKFLIGVDNYLNTPPGFWTLKVYDLSGMQIIHKSIVGGQVLDLEMHTNRSEGVAVYFLEPNSGHLNTH